MEGGASFPSTDMSDMYPQHIKTARQEHPVQSDRHNQTNPSAGQPSFDILHGQLTRLRVKKVFQVDKSGNLDAE